MLFNSLEFALFLIIAFTMYWFLFKNKLKYQNIFLLISSYLFYSFWDWRFSFLLLFSTILDYLTGIKIFESKKKDLKLFWMWLSIIINIGFLGVFKYFNFFYDSLENAMNLIGIKTNLNSFQIILPVGISFYTFHGISYVIDMYNNKIEPERNLINYGVFVSFFPLLVAGPIERATHLLPQIKKERTFSYIKSVDGLKRILWGLFKKMVIADNCADIVNTIFGNFSTYSGSTLFLGGILFSIQIYCDFSGYSDVALGTAQLFGITLLKNFSYPYFSRDIAEFWRRWHISLSSWFKDYLYFPLGGSKGGLWMRVRNTFIIFIISGLWHGANWTFIAWGLLNAFYILPSIVFQTNRRNIAIVAEGKVLPTAIELLQIIKTFILATFAWILFRSNNLKDAYHYISKILSNSIFQTPETTKFENITLLTILIIFFFIIEWLGREKEYAIQEIGRKWTRISRWIFYIITIFLAFFFSGKEQEFIYFQF